MSHQGTVVIVIYNKQILESNTYKSLIQSSSNLKNIDLILWNNGPSSIQYQIQNEEADKFHSITSKESLSNKGLAEIYNIAIELFNNSFTVLLDDDSNLSETYITSMLQSTPSECSVPILTHEGKAQSPTIHKKKINSLSLPEDRTKFRAVGSGVIIGKDISDKMKTIYGSVFDERFLLYGVDTTFFIRLERANLLDSLKIIPGFEHSYSRLSNEADPINEFRKKERAYDKGLNARYYKSKPSLIIYTIKTGLRSISNKLKNKENMEAYIFNAIITGKHYRKK